jgi:hypothetical protein
MARYTLSITFKSNEYPFSTEYKPVHPIEDENEAIDWKCGMAEGLGDEYMVTLLRDGVAVPSEQSLNQTKACNS